MAGFPLIIQPDADEIYVDGTLDGRPYRFLLDTGAARTSLVTDDYIAAFPSAEMHHSSGVFAASSEDLITVPSIELGSISRENVTVVRSAADSGRRSLIGMDLLKDYCCHFFFDENCVSVDAAGEARDAVLQDLLLDQRFHPYVEIHFGDVNTTAYAVWDTGASLTIVDTNFVSQHPAYFQEVGHSTGTDSTGAQMETPMFLMAVSRIGSHDFPPHRVAGVDLAAVNATLEIPMNLILGYSTLRHANWLFDFPRRVWAITRFLSS